MSEPNEVFCVTVCIQFFLCQCLCIQKMNVFKNDNWPGDYSLLFIFIYVSKFAHILLFSESEKGARFGKMASAS